jgi:hypothetical protein
MFIDLCLLNLFVFKIFENINIYISTFVVDEGNSKYVTYKQIHIYLVCIEKQGYHERCMCLKSLKLNNSLGKEPYLLSRHCFNYGLYDLLFVDHV